MRVMVVDDDQLVADTLAIVLREHGFEAFAVYSGELAIHAAIAMIPNLVMSDLQMVGLDGIDTAVRIRALMPDSRVILHSCQAETTDLLLQTRLEQYSLEVFPKPLLAQRLLKQVNTLYDSAQETRQ